MRSTKANCSLTVEFSLVKENILLQDERITQLFVIQSELDPFLWFGVLFVDTGIYMGSVIRFNMIVDEKYPDCGCPTIIFDPIPYHPLVDPDTGKLDTKNAFPNWNSKSDKLHQLLYFVKRVIYHAEMYINKIEELIRQDQLSENSTNDAPSQQNETKDGSIVGGKTNLDYRAFSQNLKDLFVSFEKTYNCIRTYQDNPNVFQQRVDSFKQKSCHQLFDKPASSGEDKNALIFSPWNRELHEPIRNCILAGRFTPTSLFASYHKESESVSFVPGSELYKE